MTTNPFDAVRPPEPDRTGPRRKRRREGQRLSDPNATVPDAEFTSYYGRNVVNAPPWEHGIPAYIFLGGVAAGSGLMAAGGHLAGHDELRRNGRFGAIAAIGLGTVALIADLGRPERALNMMRTVKLTSPMSVGSWILAGFGASAGAAVATETARAVLDPDARIGPFIAAVDLLASAASAFFAPPLAAYTAVLLSDTAVPLWHESYRELPFVFVSSATAAGAGLAMVTTPVSQTRAVRQAAVLGAACELTADGALGKRLGRAGVEQPLHEGKARTLHRAARALTVAGAVGAALFGGRRGGAIASGVALIAGSACTRFAVFEAGMTSATDPRYTVVPQRARAAAARARGEGATQPGGVWPA